MNVKDAFLNTFTFSRGVIHIYRSRQFSIRVDDDKIVDFERSIPDDQDYLRVLVYISTFPGEYCVRCKEVGFLQPTKSAIVKGRLFPFPGDGMGWCSNHIVSYFPESPSQNRSSNLDRLLEWYRGEYYLSTNGEFADDESY